jgi:hypothetical protein
MRSPHRPRELWSANAMLAALCAALILIAGPAEAGPCTAQIAQLHGQLSALRPNSATGPIAMQSVGAQLHRQPTPEAIRHAETVANFNADAALDRAQKADQEGDASACMEGLRQARRLYGVD